MLQFFHSTMHPSEYSDSIRRTAYPPNQIQRLTRDEKRPSIVCLTLLSERLQVEQFANRDPEAGEDSFVHADAVCVLGVT